MSLSAEGRALEGARIARSALVLSSADRARWCLRSCAQPVRELVASNVVFLPFVKGTHDD